MDEKLRERGMFEEALRPYEESKRVFDQLDDRTQGKQEQVKRIREIIAATSAEASKKK